MTTYNILEDDIYTLIRKIAIPASVGSFFTTLYNVVDTIFAGLIGKYGEGLAGVSITFPLFLLILSISIGLGAGTSALVGNSIGEKNSSKARKIAYNSFFLAIILPLIGVIIIYPMFPSILKFMKVSDKIMPYALSYIRVMYIGILTLTVPGVINSVLSVQGQTKPYRNILIVGFFLNIIFDPLFLGKNPLYFLNIVFNKIIEFLTFNKIAFDPFFSENISFLPNLGTAGIALATVLIQLFQTIYIFIKLQQSPLFNCSKDKSERKLDFCIIKDILKQGLPAMLNMITITTGIFILNYFVSYIGGKNGIAALGIGYRVEQMIMMPASGIYIAMMTIISQNKGAGNISRVYEGFKKGLISSFTLLVTGSIIIFIIKLSIISLFTSNKDIIDLSVEYLNIEVFTIPAYAVLSSCINTLQAMKKPKIPMYATLCRQFLFPLTLYPLVTFIFKLPIKFIWISVFINCWSVAIILFIITKKEIQSYKKS